MPKRTLEEILADRGEKWSKLQPAMKFATMWEAVGFDSTDITEEHEFSEHRKYRLDFAWPSCRLGVEIHGFGFGHQAQQGVAEDCAKIREAIACGWLIVPFTTRCVASKDECTVAVEFVCRLLERRHGLVDLVGDLK